MKAAGLAGAVRGKVKRTTIAGVGPKPADLVRRNFAPAAPNRLWGAGFTYLSTWAGWTYVAFVIDAYARRILGWRTATSMTADLVLDAVEQAIWTRQREDRDDFTALIAHHDHGSQYLSVAHSQPLAQAGIRPSVGAVGSSYDNALAESINGLHKTEVIRRGPWPDVNAVEITTAEWVEWYNHRRLHQYARGDLTPIETENAYYDQTTTPSSKLRRRRTKSPDTPGRFRLILDCAMSNESPRPPAPRRPGGHSLVKTALPSLMDNKCTVMRAKWPLTI